MTPLFSQLSTSIVQIYSIKTLKKLPNGLASGKWCLTRILLNKLLKSCSQIKKKHSQLDPLTFNGIPVKKVSETKHLGMILDSRLSFNSHLDEKLARARLGLGVMKQIKKMGHSKNSRNRV